MNRVAVTMMLADYAEVVGGKLYIMGGGWSVTGPGPTQLGIAMKIALPWDQANIKKSWKMRLLDQDGSPVALPTAAGEQPVELGGDFEAGRPPGLTPGTALDVHLAFNVGPLPLPPGHRFSWVLYIDEETDEGWHMPFQTRPAPTKPGPAA